MITRIHAAYILFLRGLSVAAPGLKVTCIGGDEAREVEMVVRDTCRRQVLLFGHDTNIYARDDVRWWWWNDESEILRGESLPPAPVAEIVEGECYVII